MRDVTFATLDHSRSTDKKPRNDKCPSGIENWSFYQRDLANKVLPRKHSEFVKTPINALK